MAKIKMSTSRSYWVEWTCVFEKTPDDKTLYEKKQLMTKYLQNYLKDIVSSKLKGPGKSLMDESFVWDTKNLKWVPASAKEGKANVPKGQKSLRSNISWASPWNKWLVQEWNYFYQQQGAVYSFVAYFKNDKLLRISNTTDGKGTMNPPPPPPPPSDL
jgi:hypothetical protein